MSELPQSCPTGPPPAPLDRDRDLALIDEVEAHLVAVEEALARIDAGIYGRCRCCGREIADEVLAARPTALDCGAHPSTAPDSNA